MENDKLDNVNQEWCRIIADKSPINIFVYHNRNLDFGVSRYICSDPDTNEPREDWESYITISLILYNGHYFPLISNNGKKIVYDRK